MEAISDASAKSDDTQMQEEEEKQIGWDAPGAVVLITLQLGF